MEHYKPSFWDVIAKSFAQMSEAYEGVNQVIQKALLMTLIIGLPMGLCMKACNQQASRKKGLDEATGFWYHTNMVLRAFDLELPDWWREFVGVPEPDIVAKRKGGSVHPSPVRTHE